MTTPPLILVADDETHIVNVLAVKLQSAGYKVLCAHDGEAALRIANARTPDLVITDYQMPVVNGHELCKQLLANRRTSHIPVIMITGQNIGGDTTGSVNIRAIVGKPFSPREVMNRADEILKHIPAEGIAKAS